MHGKKDLVWNLIIYQSIHRSSFFVVLVSRSFFSGDIYKTRKFIAFNVMSSTIAKKNLNKLSRRK